MFVAARRARHVLLSAVLIGSMGVAFSSDASDAGARERSADQVYGETFDLLILRTTGVFKTAVGAAFAVVAYPLSMPSGNQDEVLDRLVVEPANHTFRRELGSF